MEGDMTEVVDTLTAHFQAERLKGPNNDGDKNVH
jgi:hypothetical protein